MENTQCYYIKGFLKDIQDFLSEKTTKDEFKQAVEKGAGTYDETGSYGMTHDDVDNMMGFHRDLFGLIESTSASQKLKLYDALDSIIYTKDNKFEVSGLNNSFFRSEEFHSKGTKASVLAASAMYALANSSFYSNSGTFSIFYKNKELSCSVNEAFSQVMHGKEFGLIKERYMYALGRHMDAMEKQATQNFSSPKIKDR